MKWRLQIFLSRLIDYFTTIPLRFQRFFKWLLCLQPLHGSHKVARWFIGVILLMIDITPIPVLLEAILDLINWKTRGLSDMEIQILSAVFGNNLPFHLVGINPASIIARTRKIAFVSFQTININEEISVPNLVHEAVHIWQYRNLGSAYISEAIWAQNWGGGYNYGGKDALKQYQATGLSAFNLEQQADIVEDYFRLKNDLPLQWAARDTEIENLLEKYMLHLHD